MLDRDDVIDAYHHFLGRRPENDAVIAAHLAKHSERVSLRKAIASSREHLASSTNHLSGCLSDDLDEFVWICDRNDGPNGEVARQFFSLLDFNIESIKRLELDPFSAEYHAEQVGLYERISSRKLDQVAFEQTEEINLDFHANGHNPYTNIKPEIAAFHLLRIAKLFQVAKVPANGRVLDMGAGWGMSSEMAAYMGCRVVALDINPQFISLINRRASRLDYRIQTVHSTFDEFVGEESNPFDMIMFYECLHHAIKPWTLIANLSKIVRTGGCIAIAGEPINDYWWSSWGLRLDPMSVYCVRKFGWFESGWTLEFICECFRRANLTPSTFEDSELGIGSIIVARKV